MAHGRRNCCYTIWNQDITENVLILYLSVGIFYGSSLNSRERMLPNVAIIAKAQNGNPMAWCWSPRWNIDPDTAAPTDLAKDPIEAAAPLTVAR